MSVTPRNPNSGHGHVVPRPDGAKARCGGPALCNVCAVEAAQIRAETNDEKPQHWSAEQKLHEPVLPPLEVSVATTCTVNLGDHGERQTTAHTYIPGETVEDLVRRVFPGLSQSYGQHDATDKITLKVVVGADGTPTGQIQTPRGDGW